MFKDATAMIAVYEGFRHTNQKLALAGMLDELLDRTLLSSQ
jgi:hypothetical protein